MSRKAIVMISIIVLALFGGCMSKEKEGATAAAPDFTLQDISGKQVRLADLKGGVVMLEFWATWCPPCRAEVPAIERLHTQYSGKGLTILAIALDEGGWDGVKDFVADRKISYTVLRGTEDVSSKYKIRLIPSTFLIDKEGNIKKQYMGGGSNEVVEQDIKALL
ncbi:MAG: TlpA disulfide reductase family protein [Nitrospirota bacterium]